MSLFALVGQEYAKADFRWGVSDPNIVSLEILTVFFNGALCLLLVYAIFNNKAYRCALWYLIIAFKLCNAGTMCRWYFKFVSYTEVLYPL